MHRICLPIAILFSLFLSFGNEVTSIYDSDRKKKLTKLIQNIKITLESEVAVSLEGYHAFDLNIAHDDKESLDIQLYDANTKAELTVSYAIKKMLINYLTVPPPEKPFNCISFIHKILNVKSDLISELRERGWGWDEYRSEDYISNGDLLLLYSASDLNHPRHIAVKFTDYLYLSKAGPNSDFLLLSTVNDMKTLWQADNLLVLHAAVV